MPAPYGSWPSPFTAANVAGASPRIDGARFVGDEIWWGESVPAQGGRVTVRSSGGAELLPEPWNARSRVHEYGGGAWTADDDGTLFFVNASDQRVHRLRPGAAPEPLTAPGAQYGGITFQCGRLLAVREDLRPDPHRRSIVEIPLDASAAEDDDALRTFVSTDGFVAHPALSPEGTRIAWVQWDATRMPWESAQLHIAPADSPGEASAASVISVPTRAALQPEWVSENELLCLDDPTGRWNLFRVRLAAAAGGTPSGPEHVASADADTGGGLWVLGNRWYKPLDDGRIVAVRTDGDDRIVVIGARELEQAGRPGEHGEPGEPSVSQLAVPVTSSASIDDVRGCRVLVSGSGASASQGLWCIDLATGSVDAVSGGAPADPAWMPPAIPRTFDGPHGPVHAFDYRPTNPHSIGPAGELPPYVVMVHGGPTANVSGAASDAYAYWTSRGIGVLDVNYGGSTGYGRDYRERLDGQWGIVDVDDVIAAAQGLAQAGLADPKRIAIRGGSAGGWTVLCALVRGEAFGAGISRYGVADLRLLAAETHDFEKHYLTGLVGPLPEAESVYVERSPLTHSARIDVPVLLEQGSEDRVVPPSQSEAIRDALAARGVPHEYVLYPGEGHGFRRAETIIASFETELTFLGRVFGFEPRL